LLPADVTPLAHFFDLLAEWNHKIILTAFDLDNPTDQAIDRLILEPVAAARQFLPPTQCVIDVDSGSGSPALPMKICARRAPFVLVESDQAKATFLRQAACMLELADTVVETESVEDIDSSWHGKADVVTIRGARLDDGLAPAIARLLAPAGRVFWFGGFENPPGTFRVIERHDLIASRLVILTQPELVTLDIHCARCHGAVELQFTDWRQGDDVLAQRWTCPYCQGRHEARFPGVLAWVAKTNASATWSQ
jgi:16S rRNA (guanine527-N7)-methyltransferase